MSLFYNIFYLKEHQLFPVFAILLSTVLSCVIDYCYFFKCQNSNDNLGTAWWWTKWSLGSKRMRRKVRMFYWTNGGGWLNGWVGEESGLRCPYKEKWATSWVSKCWRLAYHYCTDDCEAMDSYPLSGQIFFFGCGVTLQGLKSGLSIKHHFEVEALFYWMNKPTKTTNKQNVNEEEQQKPNNRRSTVFSKFFRIGPQHKHEKGKEGLRSSQFLCVLCTVCCICHGPTFIDDNRTMST